MSQIAFLNIIALVCGAFRTFIIYKFMTIFFNESKIHKKLEIIFYIIFWLINTILYVFFTNPVINLLNSVVSIFLLALIYSSLFFKKFVATGIVLIYNLLIESMAYYVIPNLGLEKHTTTALGYLASVIILYLTVLLFSNFKNMKSNYKVSGFYTVIIFSISAFSIFLSVVLMFMYDKLDSDSLYVILCITGLLAINVFIVYLYDMLNKYYQKEIDGKLMEQQNHFYLKQMEMMNQSQDYIKHLRHDMKHHFSTLKIMADDNQPINEYINKFLNSIENSAKYADSGNIIIDSILNYKFQEAVAKNTEIDIELKIPKELNITPFDMNIMLGNLLDNAIEAVSKKDGDKKIKVSICFDRDIIYIDIWNTFDGNLLIEEGIYKTINEDKINHGFGLLSVKKVLEKYNGEIKISSNCSIFAVNVLLFNN